MPVEEGKARRTRRGPFAARESSFTHALLGASPMSFETWVALVGALLLFVALAAVYLRRLPISTAIVYLLVGIAVGPAGVGWLAIDVTAVAPTLERVSEIAVIVSLFVSGLKLRLPLRAPHWRAAALLAAPVMLVCIIGVAVVAHYGLGLPVAAALLLGAILAPTDPVLASSVAVSDASDRDRMRYALSGEAGLNDGMAFPFVVLALSWHEHGGPGSWLAGWTLHRWVWAVPAALAIGYAGGLGMGRFAITLRSRHRDARSPNDFFALALIALAYAGAQAVGAWGFLAAFAAGVGLRRAEIAVVQTTPHPRAQVHSNAGTDADAESEDRHGLRHDPAEAFVAARAASHELEEPAVAAGVLVGDALSFGETAERLMEVTLIVFIGICVLSYWDSRALVLAAALFLVIRPVAVLALLQIAPLRPRQRLLMAWFGIRGVGSLYYLAHVMRLNPGLTETFPVVELTIGVIAASIVLHGATSRPLLQWYERFLERDRRERERTARDLSDRAPQP